MQGHLVDSISISTPSESKSRGSSVFSFFAWSLLLLIALFSLSFLTSSAQQSLSQEGQNWISDWELRSEDLLLEVQAEPFRYRITNSQSHELLFQSLRLSLSEDRSRPLRKSNPETLSYSSLAVQSDKALAFILKTNDESSESDSKSISELSRISFRLLSSKHIQVILNTPNSSVAVGQSFHDLGGEYFGLWEHSQQSGLGNRGSSAKLVAMKHAKGCNYANARAPFFMTQQGCAFYMHTPAKSHFAFAQGGENSIRCSGRSMEYHFLYGPKYSELMRMHNKLTGPPLRAPLWALGNIFWRDDAHMQLGAAKNAKERVLLDAAALQDRQIHASAFWLDRPYGTGEHGWGNFDFDSSFGGDFELIEKLNSQGLEVLLWMANRCSGELLEEAVSRKLLLKENGKWPALDLRKSEAVALLQQKLAIFLEAGVKGFKIDRGDEDDVPEDLQNQMSLILSRAVYEVQQKHHWNDSFSFARNVFGAARQHSAHWNGDTENSFYALGLSLRHYLRSALINFPVWGSDIGGFKSKQRPSKDLFARWLAFGAYTPLFEMPLQAGNAKRLPWKDYDADFGLILQGFAKRHHQLIPYVRSYLELGRVDGLPIARPMFLQLEDHRWADCWDQFFYGDHLLVAPVLQKNAKKRIVKLPSGRWLDGNHRDRILPTQSTLQAPQQEIGAFVKVEVEAPLHQTPYFIQEGAILVTGDILRGNNNWTKGWQPSLKIEIFPSMRKKAAGFDYYDGVKSRRIEYKWKPGELVIRVPRQIAKHNKTSLAIYIPKTQLVKLNGTAIAEDELKYDTQHQLLELQLSDLKQLRDFESAARDTHIIRVESSESIWE